MEKEKFERASENLFEQKQKSERIEKIKEVLGYFNSAYLRRIELHLKVEKPGEYPVLQMDAKVIEKLLFEEKLLLEREISDLKLEFSLL